MRTAVIILGAVTLGLAVSSKAHAQSTSLFGSSGSQSSGSRSGSSSSGGLSSSSMSSGGGLQGGGGSGGGGRGTGGGNFSGPQINEPGSLSSQSVGRGTGFVGQQNQGNFVGNRLAGTGGTTGAPPSLGGLGNLGGGGSNFNNQNGPQQGSSSRRAFRPRYRIGFSFQPVTAEIERRTNVQAGRLATKNPALAGLEISVDEHGLAEIRGQAPTDDARLLIENLVRLEPGVRSITNLVEVTPAAETP